MPFPPIPKELSVTSQASIDEQIRLLIENISALYIYLQRLRDQSTDTIAEVIENDPSLGGATFFDSASIDFTKDGNSVTAEVLNDSNIQKVEIAEGGTLKAVRKRLNFLGGVSVADNPVGNRADISIASGALSRLVSSNFTIPDKSCIISTRYFEIAGVLELQGDATLEVL